MVFIYTALGDSITAGAGATSPYKSYPNLVVSMFNRDVGPAMGQVLAQPGWTSAALVSAVFENSYVNLQMSRAITIWVGGDDVVSAATGILNGMKPTLMATTLKRYGERISFLVRSIQKVSSAKIILCTQYNPFPNTPLASKTIATLNEVTCTVAARLGVAIAKPHTWFSGRERELIDGYSTGRIEDVLRRPNAPVHPNDLGHRVIAEGLYPFVRWS
jgi:acyl-CoA thioesterase I